MAVTVYMPDGTVKVLGKPSTSPLPPGTGAVGSDDRRKSSPSNGARRLKAELDRLDQVDLYVSKRKTAHKKPEGSR